MKHYILHTSRWDTFSWRTKLKLRWQVFRLGALVKPNANCPPKYAYLVDPDYQHYVPLLSSWSGRTFQPLTRTTLIEAYGSVALSKDPQQGKITYISNS